MNFNKHLNFEDLHAFLSPSKYHWINYDEDKLDFTYSRHQAAQQGTRLHLIASELIINSIKLPKTRKTLNLYVNDAIGFKMSPEVTLVYSENAFGTADAISFKKNLLRIHDYKSCATLASMHQLEVYAALFCLEYEKDPAKIDIELRIYQNDEISICVPEPEDISKIMAKIISFDPIGKLLGLS